MFTGHLKRLVRRRVPQMPRRSMWSAAEKKHYKLHKDDARKIVLDKLAYWNKFYGFDYNRVAIKNTRSRWGSCSSKKNLNFNYRILFLPVELQDYLVVHELCHLKEMNHGSKFWSLVAEQIPDYKKSIIALRTKEKDIFLHANI